jgi:hypothetical protein
VDGKANKASTFKLEIKPKIGLGNLLFGSTMQQVKGTIGEPEETEEITEEEGFHTEVWHYWEAGLSVFFDEDDNKLFSCAEVDNEDATLWGKRIFDMAEAEIVSLFREHGFPDYEAEDHPWGERRVSFDEILVDLYFEKKKLVSINFGAIIDSGQIIFWPN